MGAVSGVNKDLVVGVSLPLHLLGAVGSWRLTLAAAKRQERALIETAPSHWGGLPPEIRVSPVRHGRSDISVVEPGMPGKQDNASVAKHAVQKELWRAQQQVAVG